MRLTTLGLMSMIAAAGCHLPAQADEPLFDEATESDDRLKELHHDAGDLCLRNPSRDVEVVVACKAMIIYGLALNERGWCHGRHDESNAEKDWHICESGSDRFSLDHLTDFQ
ncbi:hypothetical protein SAMN04489859_100310 [Paracoccus alcaliphilus]|uniref:Integron gene cassette protein n=1 Tax=Paracoccus alcaliphilus TaxID=34002 RepID=A0A1H8EWW1_9RHOB|nr:hypothetical protein [Paracoccus alcaliphilus]WCR20143.1 hypothetical protein JHW40_19790 [Paracoccus alcaliphilus]SEN23377.1 hypothetical protein SAMN04489859_100310 [Paracoccus alcaliphilus]